MARQRVDAGIPVWGSRYQRQEEEAQQRVSPKRMSWLSSDPRARNQWQGSALVTSAAAKGTLHAAVIGGQVPYQLAALPPLAPVDWRVRPRVGENSPSLTRTLDARQSGLSERVWATEYSGVAG